ncbi:MAG: HAD family hydrolase [Oligoflexia bacterium]|nr:HAD family hydrolase [Oligoflexia bacterium]
MVSEPTTAPVRHLLVDLDGTLLGNRNLALSYDFLSQTLSSLRIYGGFRKSARALLAIAGELRKTSRDRTNDRRIVEAFSRRMNLSIEEGGRILREGVSAIFPTLERHFYPIEGARDFLEWAAKKYPLTLATNPIWPPEIVELRIRWAGIDPAIFREITHVRKMHAYKPSPEYFREILEQENLKPEECMLIGDKVKMDLPASRVGIRVFIVGPYKKIMQIRQSSGHAPAWRGSYADLRKMLESVSG